VDEIIEEANWKADHSTRVDPVRGAHNQFSDMTLEEKKTFLKRNPFKM